LELIEISFDEEEMKPEEDMEEMTFTKQLEQEIQGVE